MNKIKAAIADDSELVRSRLIEKLQRLQNVEILWQAASGSEALGYFSSSQPDVLILDVQMPEMTGLELLQNVKADERDKTLFIVLTNFSVDVVRKRCIKAGADHFFDKTTEFDKVFEIIRSIQK